MSTNSESKNPYTIQTEPFYLATGGEIELFEAASTACLPVMLKGPTGCGKTRFVEHMAYRLKRPLITVACHEDLFASDLIGRYLLKDDETVWVDGPLTRAVRMGAICYLDEIVEARKDTTVVIHPLTDNRRSLSIDKKGEVIRAHPDFLMVISYNPGYQSVLKDLKQSTRQRFVALTFDYPQPEDEARIVATEGQIDPDTAMRLVTLASKIRNIREQGLTEGASTRLLIYAANLIGSGIAFKRACTAALCQPLTDDDRLQETLNDLIDDLV
ncbi:CbbQ/NirQ/NorQ/GpvN family protein [Desulfosarcina ovata]|uniref:Denitrification regulatory protein NirQ n=2 Tax=Desulfosarcina ovata TaxID=83564 RepID=A0A5K8AGY1_9BACT|nr:CbbQ/NirQ/NorQ/GpvN family protein [Desulfosarcina ovata]BBO85187.1 denitrification regulatory protein NirQ [Desulfosarcina ovata subsp. sediminis]BBO91943.1 denitrification regulatory protein NirQ [Desulfosarcina ovata subsp. ovata]